VPELNPPTYASCIAGITSANHHTWPEYYLSKSWKSLLSETYLTLRVSNRGMWTYQYYIIMIYLYIICIFVYIFYIHLLTVHCDYLTTIKYYQKKFFHILYLEQVHPFNYISNPPLPLPPFSNSVWWVSLFCLHMVYRQHTTILLENSF
jgi:hypothetical protein